MSEFEFLRNITIGQYLPTGSSIHRLDTRARILSSAIILTAVTLAPRLQGLLLGFVVILALLAAARIPLGYALRGLLPPLPFLLALAGLQVLFNPRPEMSPVLLDVGPLLVKVTDLLAGAKLLVRFGALVLGLSLTSFCISTSEMIHGLESLLSPFRRLRLPTHDLILTVQITLRFIPFLAQSAERIAKAQASRGADWGAGRGGPLTRTRQALPLLLPLFLTGLRRAENLALAMEARGYGNQVVPTSLIRLHFGLTDALALMGAVVVAAIMLLI